MSRSHPGRPARAGAEGRRRPVGHRPLLVVLCGPSHAGKSTFAARHCRGFVAVSSDRIRRGLGTRFDDARHEPRVWEAFDHRKREALRAGRNVVLDACHLSPEARRHSVQGPNRRHRKVFVLFDVPLGTVLTRCRRTGRLAMDEAERMWRAFQASKPTADELERLGFDQMHAVDGDGRRRRLWWAGHPGVERVTVRLG